MPYKNELQIAYNQVRKSKQKIDEPSEVTPKKLDKNSTQKLFKQPKGLAACELQAAGPFVLP